MDKNTFIKRGDASNVIAALEAKKALMLKWINIIDNLANAIKVGDNADRFFDDFQLDEDGFGKAYIEGCVDEDEYGYSVFPSYQGQMTLHKYANGDWR